MVDHVNMRSLGHRVGWLFYVQEVGGRIRFQDFNSSAEEEDWAINSTKINRFIGFSNRSY